MDSLNLLGIQFLQFLDLIIFWILLSKFKYSPTKKPKSKLPSFRTKTESPQSKLVLKPKSYIIQKSILPKIMNSTAPCSSLKGYHFGENIFVVSRHQRRQRREKERKRKWNSWSVMMETQRRDDVDGVLIDDDEED